MVSGKEITRGMAGTFAMARGEGDWEERLDLTARGVFASFWAIPLSLPAVMLIGEVARQVQLSRTDEALAGPAVTATLQVVATVLSWSATLFVLAKLASRGQEGWRVTPLLIGFNWSRLAVNLIAGLGAAAAVAASTPLLFGPFALLATVLSVWLLFGVVKRSLDTKTGPTIGVLAVVFLVDLLVGLVVSTLASSFIGSPSLASS
ncbi:hypothetical protein [Parvularcula dongshanensis]|uniref:hypothetical protein n=1 Tax=Parvularcula dongshanensis TaxID=1173995 RepID=UPI001607B3A2|nr:hypothetical protein [Parvularcula dongshanensis]